MNPQRSQQVGRTHHRDPSSPCAAALRAQSTPPYRVVSTSLESVHRYDLHSVSGHKYAGTGGVGRVWQGGVIDGDSA